MAKVKGLKIPLESKPIDQIVATLTLKKPGKRTNQGRRDNLIEVVEELRRYVPLESEKKGYRKALDKIASDYIESLMTDRYPQLSQDIMQLRRGVALKDSGKIMEIPVFAYADINEKEWKDYGHVEGGSHLNVASKLPVIPREVREKGKEAKTFCYGVYGRALQAPVIGDYLLSGKWPNLEPSNSRLTVFWKPRAEDLQIIEPPDPDPVLTLTLDNKMYLVTTWDVENEEPFEHYIREFKL